MQSLPPPIQAMPATAEEFIRRCRELYAFAYTPVLMDMTRQVMTNRPTPDAKGAPPNQIFIRAPQQDAETRVAQCPDPDMLGFGAWLDLTEEPQVLSIPDAAARYVSIVLYDAYAQVFRCLGSRTSGPNRQTYLLHGISYEERVPGLVTLRCPNDLVLLTGGVHPEAGFDEALSFIKGITLTPLRHFGRSFHPARHKSDPERDMRPASEQIRDMPVLEVLKHLCYLMKRCPLPGRAHELEAQMRGLGMMPGVEIPQENIPAAHLRALEALPEQWHRELDQMQRDARRAERPWGAWACTEDKADNQARACILQRQPALPYEPECVTFDLYGDGKKPLNGAHVYALRFETDQYPPSLAFWSLSAQDTHTPPASTDPCESVLHSYDALCFMPDGALEIVLSRTPPPDLEQVNWQGIPEGNFSLSLRVHWPDPQRMDWQPPPIVRIR